MIKSSLNLCLSLIILLFAIPSLADGDFAKHDAEMYQLLIRINVNETAVKNLLKERNETKDEKKSKEILEDIKKNLKERKENIRRYNKIYNHVLYEHPGQMNYPEDEKDKKEGGHEKSKESHPEVKKMRYKRYDEKEIKEFEDETNKLLSNTYRDIQKKYNSN